MPQQIVQSIQKGKPPVLRGFNAINGISEKNIYAAGLKGEIWHFNGSTWKALQSPTEKSLNEICCVDTSKLFIAGQDGVLLKGDGGQFKILPQINANGDIYGLEWFKEALYVSTKNGIYRLDNDKLQPVDLKLGKGWTTKYLHANDGVLWTFGPKHLAYTEDGDQWTQVFCT
jgi:ligand-binding sensor domain-containing protein